MSLALELTGYEKLLEEFCRSQSYGIALPESSDERVFLAACHLAEHLPAVHLFLSKSQLAASWKRWAQSFSPSLQKKFVLVPEERPRLWEETSLHLTGLAHKRGKPLGDELCERQAAEPLYQAGYLLYTDAVAAVLAGAVATTAEVIRAALATIGLASSHKILSGTFLLLKEEGHAQAAKKTYLYADSGVVVEPSEEQLVEIAWASVQTWQRLQGAAASPYVAFLSFSSKGSSKHASAEKMRRAYESFAKQYPHIAADGELQFDAAIDMAVGQRKAPASQVAGRANIFIFPDLNAGNIAYKLTQRLAGFQAYGPLLQGLAKPYSDLSRGASVKDIVISAYLNILLAHPMQANSILNFG